MHPVYGCWTSWLQQYLVTCKLEQEYFQVVCRDSPSFNEKNKNKTCNIYQFPLHVTQRTRLFGLSPQMRCNIFRYLTKDSKNTQCKRNLQTLHTLTCSVWCFSLPLCEAEVWATSFILTRNHELYWGNCSSEWSSLRCRCFQSPVSNPALLKRHFSSYSQ